MSPITEDDLDRLADYVAGLLDPAETAELERLIATEPAWGHAHTALVAAQPALDEALAGLAADQMPDEVGARLDRAIEAASSGTGTATVIRLPRRRRWSRAALATVAAAAVVVACGAGVQVLRGGFGSGSGTTSSAAKSTGKQADARGSGSGLSALAPNAAEGSDFGTRTSGTDYTRQTLARAASGPATGVPDAARATSEVPDELRRLTGPSELSGCLAAITALEGGRAISADYARYEGRPALVVVLAGGSVAVVATGPDCGLPGRGADLLDTAP